MRFLAVLVSLSLVLPAPAAALAKVPALTGPYKPVVRTAPIQADSLRLSGSLENALHAMDPVLLKKVPSITAQTVQASLPVDEKRPELSLSRSSVLFDQAKPFKSGNEVLVAEAGVRPYGLFRRTPRAPAAKPRTESWGDQARELTRLKAEAPRLVRAKVWLAVGSIMTLSTVKLLALTLGYWGLGIGGAAVVFIAAKFLRTAAREKDGRREAWRLSRELAGGAPTALEVVALADAVRLLLVKVLAKARSAAPEHAEELERFLSEVESGERKNWSLTAAATNILGTAEPLLDAYRNQLWDEGSFGPDFAAREAELAELVERLNAAKETGDRATRDLRFLVARLERGQDRKNLILIGWKIGVLQREARGADPEYARALLELGNLSVALTVAPTAEKAEAFRKAAEAAIGARRP